MQSIKPVRKKYGNRASAVSTDMRIETFLNFLLPHLYHSSFVFCRSLLPFYRIFIVKTFEIATRFQEFNAIPVSQATLSHLRGENRLLLNLTTEFFQGTELWNVRGSNKTTGGFRFTSTSE